MTQHSLQQELIRRGIASLGNVTAPMHRAALLEAGADLINDEELATQCRTTAACLRETEGAQLRLFNTILATTHS